MAVEELDPDCADDLKQENEDIETWYGGLAKSRVRRLSFFAKTFKTPRGLRSVTEDQFLGYVIVKEDTVRDLGATRRIYESVILPSRHINNFTKGSQKWQCQVGEEQLTVPGYLYAQQNNR